MSVDKDVRGIIILTTNILQASKFDIYVHYCTNKPKSTEVLMAAGDTYFQVGFHHHHIVTIVITAIIITTTSPYCYNSNHHHHIITIVITAITITTASP